MTQKPGHPAYIPADYARIKVVGSLGELFTAVVDMKRDKGRTHNVVLFPRTLSGDFNGLAQMVAEKEATSVQNGQYFEMTGNYLRKMGTLPRPDVETARQQIIADIDAIKKFQQQNYFFGGRMPIEVRVIRKYDLDLIEGFHKDGRPRICCGYTAPVTEGLRDEDAITIDGRLRGNIYKAKDGALPFSFAPGDLWYQYGGGDPEKKPYFIHRGPAGKNGQPRLLLLAGLR